MIFPQFIGLNGSMEKCWRCNSRAVPELDDLGLCDPCLEMLRDPEVTRAWGHSNGRTDQGDVEKYRKPVPADYETKPSGPQ